MPLNQFRDLWPDLFATYIQKYQGRETIMAAKVPILECLWNDVLHFSPAHPRLIAQALRDCGDLTPRTRKWLCIPIDLLEAKNTAVFDTLPYMTGGRFEYREEHARPFAMKHFEELKSLPAPTLAYYRTEILAGRPPLLFNGIPHVLYRGSVEIVGVEVLDWEGHPLS